MDNERKEKINEGIDRKEKILQESSFSIFSFRSLPDNDRQAANRRVIAPERVDPPERVLCERACVPRNAKSGPQLTQDDWCGMLSFEFRVAHRRSRAEASAAPCAPAAAWRRRSGRRLCESAGGT